jgi:hypothetical protein
MSKQLENEIDLDMAIQIKNWREFGDDEDNCGLTWRALVYNFIIKYPEITKKFNILNTQEYGMLLCEVAKRRLEGTDNEWLNYI